MPDHHRPLTIEEAADRLGVTVRMVRRLVAERRLPYHKVGRWVRFDPVEIDEWFAATRVAPLEESRHLIR